MAENCPCESGLAYSQCCEPLHSGAPVPDAERLMRSRYCAYALNKVDYIVATCVPSQQALLNRAELQSWADNTQWLGLAVLRHESLDKTHSAVEFAARFMNEEGEQVHQERSLFVKIDGRWYFVDPTVPLPSNKQPCVCGSGKKFKHCCGGLL